MAKPDEPLLDRVRYTKMVLNQNPIEHLVAELYKAYDYIDFLESQIDQPSPNLNPDFDPNLNPDLKRGPSGPLPLSSVILGTHQFSNDPE